jgi:hypothetical protein
MLGEVQVGFNFVVWADEPLTRLPKRPFSLPFRCHFAAKNNGILAHFCAWQRISTERVKKPGEPLLVRFATPNGVATLTGFEPVLPP